MYIAVSSKSVSRLHKDYANWGSLLTALNKSLNKMGTFNNSRDRLTTLGKLWYNFITSIYRMLSDYQVAKQQINIWWMSLFWFLDGCNQTVWSGDCVPPADSTTPREPPRFATGTAPSESWRCYMVRISIFHNSLFLHAFSICQYGILPPRLSEAIAIRTTHPRRQARPPVRYGDFVSR